MSISSAAMTSKNQLEAERVDIGLLITLVPKFHNPVKLFVFLESLGTKF